MGIQQRRHCQRKEIANIEFTKLGQFIGWKDYDMWDWRSDSVNTSLRGWVENVGVS